MTTSLPNTPQMPMMHTPMSSPAHHSTPAVLLVEDDMELAQAIRRAISRSYTVDVTNDAPEALIALRDRGPYFAIVSDLNIPGMDGLTLMAHAQKYWPKTARIMLTGEARLAHAVHALNTHSIFRFLLKPCPPTQLRDCLSEALDWYRLQHLEADLMERTWRETTRAMMSVLAAAQPAAFGRADRLAARAKDLTRELNMGDAWRAVTCARLSQLGAIGLTPEQLHVLDDGAVSARAKQDLLLPMPVAAARLLEQIPRLEPFVEILLAAGEPKRLLSRQGSQSTAEAAVVRMALLLDVLPNMASYAELCAYLGAEASAYSTPLLQAAFRRLHQQQPAQPTRRVNIGDLGVGMRLASELRSASGLLLAAKGQLITESLLRRIAHHWSGQLSDGHVQILS
ncbi:MAG: response regulator [Gemmatimonadaceae bacterium]|nr:response regulator [Gemmatimonadaceae bacterium]